MKAVLHRMVKHLDSAPVDSHSLARLAYTELYRQKIDVSFCVGEVTPSTVDGQKLSNHAWLECCGYIVDYRAAKKLEQDAPHGFFTVREALDHGLIYNGKQVKISPLDSHVVEFLTATSPALPI